MRGAEIFESWLASLSSFSLDGFQMDMAIFSLAEVQDAGVEAAELAAFILDAYRAYSREAGEGGFQGWFYAWHDEQAGQLRMCAARIDTADQLPFERALAVTDDPAPLAVEAIASPFAHGLRLDEMIQLAPGETPPPEPELPPLVVFARPMRPSA